jgi:pimeloyl-ACP methyl ester carboxylesterase
MLVGGEMLDHAIVGRGDTVVIMIHGLLGRAAELWPLAKRLAKQRPELSLVLPDLRGHGRSPPLAPDATLASLAEDVAMLADRLGASRFSIVGHSMGGRVALALGSSAADRIDQAVVLDVSASDLSSRPSPIARMIEALLAAPEQAADRAAMRDALLEAGAGEAEADALLVHVEVGSGAKWKIDRRALADLRMRTMNTDLWDAVRRLRVGLVYGTRSPFVKPEDVALYQSAGAGVVAIEGAGHLLHLEAPDAVAGAIASRLL